PMKEGHVLYHALERALLFSPKGRGGTLQVIPAHFQRIVLSPSVELPGVGYERPFALLQHLRPDSLHLVSHAGLAFFPCRGDGSDESVVLFLEMPDFHSFLLSIRAPSTPSFFSIA